MQPVRRILLPALAVALLLGITARGSGRASRVYAAPAHVSAASFTDGPVHPICPIGSWRATNLAGYLSGFFPVTTTFTVVAVTGGLRFTFRDDFTFNMSNDNIEVIGNISLPHGGDPLLVDIHMTGDADGTYVEDTFGHLALSNVASGFLISATVNGVSIGPSGPTLAGGVTLGGVYTCEDDNMTYTPDLTGQRLTDLVGPIAVPGGGSIPVPSAGTLSLSRVR